MTLRNYLLFRNTLWCLLFFICRTFDRWKGPLVPAVMVFISLSLGTSICCSDTCSTWEPGCLLFKVFSTLYRDNNIEDDAHAKLIIKARFPILFQSDSDCQNPEVCWSCSVNAFLYLCTGGSGIVPIPSSEYVNPSRMYWPVTPPVNC